MTDAINGPYCRVEDYIEATGGDIIALVFGFRGKDQANATGDLLAAAWDMREALKALDAYWSDDFPGGPDNNSPSISPFILHDDTVRIWKQIRASIAKSEGLGQ